MSQLPEFSIVESSLQLAGSLFSLVGSAFILICYTILPLEYHFRHVLILNLSIADFFNALTNAVGGIYILSHERNLGGGPACVLQGLVGQVTVQATDCAILAIAVTTVYTITKAYEVKSIDNGPRYRKIILVSCAIWALPLFTGFLALGKGWYVPVTGNWCWLVAKPGYLRYVLTHAWRFLFIIIEICLYVYLHIWIRRHYRSMSVLLHPVDTLPVGELDPREVISALDENGRENWPRNYNELQGTSSSDKDGMEASLRLNIVDGSTSQWSLANMTGLRGTHRPFHSLTDNSQYQAIQKILLLNGYPFAYIILWIPGIANRLVEASGHTSRVTHIMQASTQLVGLANAVTYGWNETIAEQIRKHFRKGTNVE